MVKDIVNAFDHMGFCLVLNLTTVYTDDKWAVIWPPIFATRCYFCYQLLDWVTSTCYQLKKSISNTVVLSLLIDNDDNSLKMNMNLLNSQTDKNVEESSLE